MSLTIVRTGAGGLALLALALGGEARAGGAGVAFEAPVEVAAGDAYRGPWRMNRSEFHYVDDPTVALDETGIVAVAWADQAAKDILVQIFEPDGGRRLEPPVNVSRSPDTFSWLPRMILTDGARQLYVLWQEIVFSGGSHGGETFFARSLDGGRTFEEPLNLSNTIAGAGKGRLSRRYWHNGSLDLVMGPGGELYAAWTEYEGGLRFSRSEDDGASFSPPLHVAGDDELPARGPSLAVAADGAIHVAWTVGEDPAADIRIATSRDGGRSFEAPRIVHASAGHADAPKLAAASDGTLHLAYAESPGGPFARYHIRYSRSTDGGRSFEAPGEVSGAQAERFDSVGFPALALDGAGNPYLAFELFPDRRHYPRGLGFARSEDGGKSFEEPVIVPGTGEPDQGLQGSLQGLLMRKLAVNQAGEVALVNSTYRDGRSSHIWLIRGRALPR